MSIEIFCNIILNILTLLTLFYTIYANNKIYKEYFHPSLTIRYSEKGEESSHVFIHNKYLKTEFHKGEINISLIDSPVIFNRNTTEVEILNNHNTFIKCEVISENHLKYNTRSKIRRVMDFIRTV